jgi:DNA-binding beta-propeller fold protein YncE
MWLVGLKALSYIDLPVNVGKGGFDHAAVDRVLGLLYVAHTANDAVDVVDIRTDSHVRSVPNLKGVAGALVDEPSGVVFSSNRGEDSVGWFFPDSQDVVKVGVGMRPNGLAYDPGRRLLLCANVGDPNVPGSASVTMVGVATRSVLATIPMPGRTRWAVFDPRQQLFFVNIAEPFQVAVIDPRQPDKIARHFEVPARGPHGLELDGARRRLYCACDAGTLVALDADTGSTIDTLELSGVPDVIFLDAARSHLFVAIGDPGVIDVLDVAGWKRLEVVTTERGAHTIALDATAHRVYAFLPDSHRAMVFHDPA